jgi:hypothetical protein
MFDEVNDRSIRRQGTSSATDDLSSGDSARRRAAGYRASDLVPWQKQNSAHATACPVLTKADSRSPRFMHGVWNDRRRRSPRLEPARQQAERLAVHSLPLAPPQSDQVEEPVEAGGGGGGGVES